MAVKEVAISVVITTRNRAEKLAVTLSALADQRDIAFDWELIVVDNASTDATAQVLESAAAELPLVVLRYDKPGKCRAQNYALEHVRGTLLTFTDDDVGIDAYWLSSLWRAARGWPDAELFCGPVVARLIGDVPVWLEGKDGQAIIERHCGHYRPREQEGPTDVPALGANMTIRRSALGERRFDENVGPDGTPDYIKGGDTDLNKALMAQGHRCVYVPDAAITHYVHTDQLTLPVLFQGAYRRGRKNAYLYPRTGGVQLAGASLALWIRLAKQWLRYRLSANAAPLKRYEIGMKYHYRRGYLDQMRRRAQA
ncbi:glycoprotein 3-alpha-L-fucosyltransferase [Salinisphaera shabanensis E1L3A]|uniref:Glycoprotein 3-alpha-L-fucosyltransferase n=1 Tax=Salinisphaera shabanensis E1L3A TaxID=1033802 RepID=U2EGX1_9GAMM|nr:glycosyltransferase family 2 protein [Salinisphaera shabanensis]ERJ17647.1 glycoprotein 3-alpha-L-fucosyltransferase [Salinisphaera shabanensis E1L3A]